MRAFSKPNQLCIAGTSCRQDVLLCIELSRLFSTIPAGLESASGAVNAFLAFLCMIAAHSSQPSRLSRPLQVSAGVPGPDPKRAHPPAWVAAMINA